jgi:hypothetical protein
MEFVQLLNVNDFFTVFKSANDEARIDVCSKVMLHSIRIVESQNGYDFYIIDTEFMIWKKKTTAKINEALATYVNNFLGLSVQFLQKEHPRVMDALLFEEKDEKLWKLMETSHFGSITSWKLKLIVPNVNLDEDITGIHFLNGRCDLKSDGFTDRDPYGIMITKTLSYKYKPFENDAEWFKELSTFFDFLSKIYREADVVNYISSVFGEALRGETASQSLLFCYGTGANGKSTVENLIFKTFEDLYCKKFKSNDFDSASEANWACIGIKLTHRFLFWDEPTTETKKVTSVLKQICNGQITARNMRSDNNRAVKINGKLFITANKILLFDSTNDGGISRRFNYYRCKNRFVDANPNPANYEYLKSPIGTDTYIMSDELKMTVFHYFAYFARQNVFHRPPQVVTGDKIYDINKLLNYSLIKMQGANVLWDDFTVLLDKIFDLHIPNHKLALSMVMKLQVSYDPKKKAKSVLGQVQGKGALLNVTWSEWGLSALTQNIPFEFSELPDPASEYPVLLVGGNDEEEEIEEEEIVVKGRKTKVNDLRVAELEMDDEDF